MRIVSCYIEGFGRLSKQDICFDRNLQQFCQQNGTGKTTLASFIKAMLYGLPTDGKGRKFNDRKHFYPFDGGRFGGNLILEHGGATYKIERFFDRLSETKDTLTVYRNGTLTAELGEKIGEKLLGIDQDAFERTLYVTSDQIEIESTDSINGKLAKYVENEDEESLKEALEALSEKRKKLKPTRGENGMIPSLRKEITSLMSQIADKRAVAGSLSADYCALAEMEQQKRELLARQQKLFSTKAVLAQWEQYEQLLSDSHEAEERMQALLVKYPKGLPDAEQAAALCREADALWQAKAKADTDSGTHGEAYLALKKKFAAGIPTEEELLSVKADAEREKELRKKAEELTAEEQEAARALALHRFSAKTPTDSDRAELSRLEEQYKQYSLDIEAHKEVGGNSQKQAGGRSFVFSVLLIVAAVLAVIGVACLAVKQTVVGVVLLALCVAVAVGALVLRHGALSGKGKASPEDALAKMEENCRQVKISLHKKLNEYGYYEAVSVLLDCERFRRDFEEYLALKARREQTLLRLSEVQDSHGALCGGLTALSARYGYGETVFSAFADQLREDVIMLTFIEKERARKHKEREDALLHVKKIADTLAEALKPYGIALSEDVRAQMQTLKEDALCFESERKNAEASAKKAEDFRLQKGLTEKPQSEEGADAVSDSLEELQREIRTKETEIADKESCVEEADALQAQLDEKQQLLDYCQQRYKVLKGAEELLEKADQAITDKYISPIKDAFCAYSTALERVLGEKVSVNKDFQLSFEHAGEARSEKHFSAGQRSICALCYRLSLIDNMYADEQPFIIMDDPFVHLDAEHMQKTAELLKELSLQRQIIYFCCHESRKM